MEIESFVSALKADFWCGVPDSQLRPLCDYLTNTYGSDPRHHIIAANEGNCAAIAAGYHLATGKTPAVYMQNSGEGNIINPLASLLHEKVYSIPCIFVIGWRGEPGVHDEPQHIFQGEVTLKLLEDMGVAAFVIDKNTSDGDLERMTAVAFSVLTQGKQVAFVIKKGALSYSEKVQYANENSMVREEVIKHIVAVTEDDPIVSTTGKASRELFEIRVSRGQGHGCDFLTVGSMGHSSSIALGIALQKPNKKIWCLDGDGAMLMHMGAMAVIGANAPKNFVHVILNNGAHESVGGMPTVAQKADVTKIAKACGYQSATRVRTYAALDRALKKAKEADCLSLIEVCCSIGSRADLGRPTTTPIQNKIDFMKHLQK